MVKYTQTIRRLLQRNYLSVFDHFVGLALKSLTGIWYSLFDKSYDTNVNFDGNLRIWFSWRFEWHVMSHIYLDLHIDLYQQILFSLAFSNSFSKLSLRQFKYSPWCLLVFSCQNGMYSQQLNYKKYLHFKLIFHGFTSLRLTRINMDSGDSCMLINENLNRSVVGEVGLTEWWHWLSYQYEKNIAQNKYWFINFSWKSCIFSLKKKSYMLPSK